MTLQSDIANARRQLEAAGIDPVEAAVDADLLARVALGWDRAQLLASLTDPAPSRFQPAYATLVERRTRREPAAYIAGHREFWGLDFEVGPGALVPRPETELIVEEALAHVGGAVAALHTDGIRRHGFRVADVGTGTGCLAIALALELPAAQVVATDTARRALDLARRNAVRHEVTGRIAFLETDLLAEVDAGLDLIVSNPPYVPEADLAGLAPEVRDFEPRDALSGGRDGLDVIRRLLLQAESRLKEHGLLIFEFGFGQEAGVRSAIARRPAFRVEKIRADLQGVPRTAVVKLQP